MVGGGFYIEVTLKWFKHYENAHTNNFIEAILGQKNGHDLHSMYWLLLEVLCNEFKKDNTEFIISADRLMGVLRIKYQRKLDSFIEVLEEICSSFDEDLFKFTVISNQTSKKIYKIEAPIMLELIGREFKRTRTRSGEKAAKKKEERKKNKNKNILSSSEDVTLVVNYLNEKTGKNFKASGRKTQSLINARFSDGFKIEDFTRVIDTKCDQWENDSSMSQYLRPETLFGNKFESYLNEKPSGMSAEREAEIAAFWKN